jgi:hypothetical protein
LNFFGVFCNFSIYKIQSFSLENSKMKNRSISSLKNLGDKNPFSHVSLHQPMTFKTQFFRLENEHMWKRWIMWKPWTLFKFHFPSNWLNIYFLLVRSSVKESNRTLKRIRFYRANKFWNWWKICGKDYWIFHVEIFVENLRKF